MVLEEQIAAPVSVEQRTGRRVPSNIPSQITTSLRTTLGSECSILEQSENVDGAACEEECEGD
jgi:hypothetical protein